MAKSGRLIQAKRKRSTVSAAAVNCSTPSSRQTLLLLREERRLYLAWIFLAPVCGYFFLSHRQIRSQEYQSRALNTRLAP